MSWLRWFAALFLGLILRVPFILGMLAGVLGLFVIAFLEGFYTVYEGRGT